MTKAASLHAQLSSAAQIDGVSVGDWNDRKTWRIDFALGATAQQRADAQRIADAFDIDGVAPQSVKDEARRRILARYPDWKQANMTAHGVELVNIRVSIGSWTQQQTQEAADLSAAWDWVKAVRRASDVLEATTPIPADYVDDRWWPKQ